MIGHGSPSDRFFARMARAGPTQRAASFQHWSVLALLAIFSFTVQAQEPQPTRGMTVRVLWGGGQPATWTGTVSISGGEFTRLVPLGVGPDDNATVLLLGRSIRIRPWKPSSFNGFDVRTRAELDAELELTFQNAEDSTRQWTRRVKLRDLLTGPLSFDLDDQQHRIVVQRAPGDELQVEWDQDHMIFRTKAETELQVFPVATDFSPAADGKLRVYVHPSGQDRGIPVAEVAVQSDKSGVIPPIGPIQLVAPDTEGVYDWDLVLIENQKRGLFTSERVVRTRRIQFVALAEQESPAPSQTDWQETFAIDPTKPDRWTMRRQLNQLKWPTRYPPLLGSGAQTVIVQGLPMIELAPKGWQAIALPTDEPHVPHVVELEYRATEPMALGVSILEPNALGAVPPLGVDSGIQIPSSTAHVSAEPASTTEIHRLVFWPSTREPYLILANHDERRTAVFGKIRVLRGPARLAPAANTSAASEQSGSPAAQPPRRGRLLYLERPTFAQALGAAQVLDKDLNQLLDDWTTVYAASQRLTEFLRANDYTGLVLSVAADGTAIYPSDHLQPTPRWDGGAFFSNAQDPVRKDVLGLLFAMFDRAGLTLIPVVELSSRFPDLELQRGGDDVAPFDLISVDGQVWGAQPAQRGRPPYNPLNSAVQSEIGGMIEELASRYAHHRSFAGLGLAISDRSILGLPGPQWGWDEVTRREFQSAMAGSDSSKSELITLVGPSIPDQLQAEWIRWSTGRLTRFLSQLPTVLRRTAPGANIYLIPVNPTPDVVPIRTLANAVSVTAPPDRLSAVGLDAPSLGSVDGLVTLDGLAAGHLESAATRNNSTDAEPASASQSRGVLFDHESSWAHFEEFERRPPFASTAPLLRMQQLTPAGTWNRRRYAAALAAADRTLIMDGGSTIPQGQDAALADWVQTFVALPDVPFVTVRPDSATYELPLVVRQHRSAIQSYFYVVNHSPWTVTVDLAVKGSRSLQWMGARGPATVTTGESARYQFEMPPFELVAASAPGDFEVVDIRARFPAASLGMMQREIQNLKAKLAATDPGDAKSVLENPSLEAVTGQGGIPGWMVSGANGDQTVLDATHPYDGATALRIRCNGAIVSVRSNPFALPRTGRLSISAWLRSDAGPVPPIRFLVEAANEEQLVYRFSQIAQPAAESSTGAWNPFVIHVDDLPIDARQLRIGFDLETAGTVWIDRVEIRDRWLDPAEVQSLKQLLNLANYKLQEQGDAVGCLRILESYWPRFIDDQIPGPAAKLESATLPSADGSVPALIK